ncbi:MAG: pyroglutamyl-peptidase I [Clostridia bacterium]|nr:pyroglutamyl-peptidase I [Clostridia bacterium]
MNIIVTGFEPFGGETLNASWEAVKGLSGVRKILLPVSFRRAAAMIRDIASSRPDAILCVGEAGGRNKISVERVAMNLMDARIPDNDGYQPVDVKIREGGPAAYFSGLPTRAMAEAMENAELSYTAGTYVCNAVFYTMMDAVKDTIPAGFIHVPRAMETPEVTEALAAAVRIIAAG